MEMKIHRLTRRIINILNENASNTPSFSNNFLNLSLQLLKEYYERLVSNIDVGFMTMIKIISFGLVKRIASLSVDE